MTEATKTLAQLKKASKLTRLAFHKNGPKSYKRGQGALLNALLANDGTTQRELVKTMGMDRSDLKGIVKKAERNGYVTIEDCDAKHTYAVKLTDEGRKVAEKRVAANLTAKFVPEYYEVHRRRIDDVYRQQVSWGLDSADVRSRLGARYARYILSALERNCDARAGLNYAGRVAFCRSVMDDDLFGALVLSARPRGGAARVVVGLLKTRSALVWCAVGRIIHLVRSRAGLAYRKATFSR